MNANFNDLTGRKFGYWTVIAFDSKQLSPSGGRLYRWLCKCDCGNEQSVLSTSLKNGRSRSCGCGIGRITCTTHGLTRTYIHRKWEGMKARCYNPNNKDYKYYGGRGIMMCQRIFESPKSIIDLIGHRKNFKLSIDRIDNNGNYSCGNCPMCNQYGWTMNLRWATAGQQVRNRGKFRKRIYDSVA